jgi:hypothetical protein
MTTPRARALCIAALLVAAVAGCGDRAPKPPELAEVFPKLPLPPQARFVGQAGGEDALQLTFHSKAAQDQIEKYYTHVFSGGGWRLVNRAKTSDGTLVLLAEQQGPPLWVRIRPTDPSGNTVVELSGARVSGNSAGDRPIPDSNAPRGEAPRS